MSLCTCSRLLTLAYAVRGDCVWSTRYGLEALRESQDGYAPSKRDGRDGLPALNLRPPYALQGNVRISRIHSLDSRYISA